MPSGGLQAQTANNEPKRPPALREAPASVLIEKDGVEYGCFTTGRNGDYARLGHILIDYADLWNYAIYLETRRHSQKLELGFQSERVDLWKAQTAEEKQTAEYMKTLFDSETARRLNENKQAKALAWIPWSIVVVESLIVFGLSAWIVAEAD